MLSERLFETTTRTCLNRTRPNSLSQNKVYKKRVRAYKNNTKKNTRKYLTKNSHFLPKQLNIAPNVTHQTSDRNGLYFNVDLSDYKNTFPDLWEHIM